MKVRGTICSKLVYTKKEQGCIPIQFHLEQIRKKEKISYIVRKKWNVLARVSNP